MFHKVELTPEADTCRAADSQTAESKEEYSTCLGEYERGTKEGASRIFNLTSVAKVKAQEMLEHILH